MQIITNQQRDEIYNDATPQQLFLYEDPVSGGKLSAIAHEYSLHEQKIYSTFAIAVGDVILGLVPQEQLPQLLIERLSITQAQAMRITADVLDFLEPLNNDTATVAPVTPTTAAEVTTPPTPPSATDTEPAAATPATPTPPTVTPPAYNTVAQNDALAAEIAAAEAQFHQLQPIRTMAHDMDTLKQAEQVPPQATDAPSHIAASQEELLAHKAPTTETTDTRWGT